MKTLQIGIMGSAADLTYSTRTKQLAREVGKLLAARGTILVFGAEKDSDSLSSIANRAAQAAGGITLGITYGQKDAVYSSPTILVASGLERGGGRELTLVLSCDVIICIGGGSGTLTEMLIAYQANIPIVTLRKSGGYSQKYADRYFDDRLRLKVLGCDTATQAVDTAMRMAQERVAPQTN